MRKAAVAGAGIVAVLALTNPDEADFREHVRQEDGIAGSLGLALTDLLSGGKGGIRRENYLVASRFYLGGDGVIPRRDLAWGVAGFFIDTRGSGAGR